MSVAKSEYALRLEKECAESEVRLLRKELGKLRKFFFAVSLMYSITILLYVYGG